MAAQTPIKPLRMRVLDLSTVIAGPNCARYLADFGADVIKVERPGGDTLRNMGWRDPRDDEGLWFKVCNRNKRLIVLDLKLGAELAKSTKDRADYLELRQRAQALSPEADLVARVREVLARHQS